MPRRAFLSFHFEREAHQAALVQNMGVIHSNRVAAQSEWEKITARGDDAIIRWIDLNMRGRSVVVVLIGAETAKRPWVLYEIEKGWQLGKGILGVYVNHLAADQRRRSKKGANPFAGFSYTGKPFSEIVEVHDLPNDDSAYQYMADNLSDWVERAISVRSRYPGWQNPRHAEP